MESPTKNPDGPNKYLSFWEQGEEDRRNRFNRNFYGRGVAGSPTFAQPLCPS